MRWETGRTTERGGVRAAVGRVSRGMAGIVLLLGAVRLRGVAPVVLLLMGLRVVTGIPRTRRLVGVVLSRVLWRGRIPRVVGHRGLVTDPSTVGRDRWLEWSRQGNVSR